MPASPIDRRQFLGSAAAAAAFLALHDVPLIGQQDRALPPAEPPRPRILSLELLVPPSAVGAMKAFYGKTLDLRLLDEMADRFTVEAGETRVTFVTSADTADGRTPFYHFAFNIPENKILDALEWQKARTPLLPIPARNRAAGFPPEVVDYSHWNAHSVFFLDPAGNVVEYIARHDLKNAGNGRFDWADILYVSEIALVADDVPGMAAEVSKGAALAQYRGGDEQFMAMGDEYGLVLVMKRGRIVDFSANPANGVRTYRTGVNVRGAKTAVHDLGAYPYRLTVEERCSC